MFTTLFSMKRVNFDELNLRFWFWDVIVFFSLKTEVKGQWKGYKTTLHGNNKLKINKIK